LPTSGRVKGIIGRKKEKLQGRTEADLKEAVAPASFPVLPTSGIGLKG
jgi:hypothetical protein